MKHKLIKTENYLLEVDDSKIKDGDWCIYKTGEIIQYLVKLNTDNLKKIVAHLPLNNSPILEGVDLLPPLEQEDDVEKLAKIENPVLLEDDWDKNKQYRDEWIKGYNKAKEKYKYTEEDLRKAWNAAYIDAMSIDEETYKPLFFEDFIQSLSQPKMPIGFECQTFDTGDDKLDGTHVLGIRTTTNSQGQSVWVGKYIY